MTTFHPITLTDKKLITSYILPSSVQDCDFSFTNLCGWHFINESSYAIIENQLIIRFTNENGQHEYLMLSGQDNLIQIVDKLEECAQREGTSLVIRGILPKTKEILEQYYPTLFEFYTDRDYFDYIYLRQELAELKGKNYQPKRNHVNKFKKEYEYTYLPLTPEWIPECMAFEADWCIKHGYMENENIKNERRALTFSLNHYDQLDLTGGLIHVHNKIVAFTFGSPINHNTFGVHFEKADINIDGAYNIINQEFSSRLPQQYIYLNREEDLGIPGLRQAKQSYHPTLLLEKCKAIKT